MAFRVLAALAVICALAGIALFFLDGFYVIPPASTYIYDRAGEHLLYTLEDERRELITLDAVISVAMAVVFALGAVVARTLKPSRREASARPRPPLVL